MNMVWSRRLHEFLRITGGELIGVRVLSHSETPALGDKIEVRKDDWILDFTGRSLTNTADTEWAAKKDGGHFDQFSGATITPRAIVRAVHKSLTFFDANRNELAVLHNKEEAPDQTGEGSK